MRRDNVNYFLVGLSTLGALGLLLVLLYKVTGRVGDTEPYHVWYDNVTGVGEGSLVTYEGYRIGYVDRIEPDQSTSPTRYRVILRIRSDWKIPRDSRARIVASGLLSDTVIDIREGRSPEVIAAGGEIPGEQAPDMFAIVNELGSELASLTKENVRPLVERLDRLVANVDRHLDDRLPGMLARLDSLLKRLDDSAATLQRVMDRETEQRIDSILGQADDLGRRLLGVVDGLQHTRGEVDRLLALATGMLDANDEDVRDTVRHVNRASRDIAASLEAILIHLEDASRNLEEFSREIRANPASLIRTRHPGPEVTP